ncbi:MAG: lytic transglycosylase domain-containing protein [Candidatus Eremiobacteraeota bacterium]|nr:lytic transglycosylase domain-containing protein [Candidatus Eremiobacteraeota bacterium]
MKNHLFPPGLLCALLVGFFSALLLFPAGTPAFSQDGDDFIIIDLVNEQDPCFRKPLHNLFSTSCDVTLIDLRREKDQYLGLRKSGCAVVMIDADPSWASARSWAPSPRAAALACHASCPEEILPLIHEIAERYALDPELVLSVIEAESGFNAKALSPAGACGLMQLMPETAKGLGVSDPYDPCQNIRGGTQYLRRQLDRFGTVELALAAYNAGPAAVEKYGGIPPYEETQNYVRIVLSRYYGAAPSQAARGTLVLP